MATAAKQDDARNVNDKARAMFEAAGAGWTVVDSRNPKIIGTIEKSKHSDKWWAVVSNDGMCVNRWLSNTRIRARQELRDYINGAG